MVRQFRCDFAFPSCTPQDFFEAVYVDEEATELFLKLNTLNGAFSVSEWRDNRRAVQFMKQFKLPESIAAILGTSTLPFKDVQTLNRSRNDEFTISSAPILQLNVGISFGTWIEIRVRSVDRACVVEVMCTCEVEGPCGMIGLIESCMEKETRFGIESFLTFCETRITHLKSLTNNSPNRSTSEGQCTNSENRILKRFVNPVFKTPEESCEGDVQSSGTSIQRIVQQMEAIEESFTNQQRRHLTVVGTSVLSAVLGATMMAIKRRQS